MDPGCLENVLPAEAASLAVEGADGRRATRLCRVSEGKRWMSGATQGLDQCNLCASVLEEGHKTGFSNSTKTFLFMPRVIDIYKVSRLNKKRFKMKMMTENEVGISGRHYSLCLHAFISCINIHSNIEKTTHKCN